MNHSIEKTKLVEVAAAVLQRPDGSFLLAQRPADKIWAGYWEFPGGKVEPGETAYHALVRELHEELGITVATAYPWLTRVFTYPHATVRLNFFRVTAWSGELHPHEGQEFSWQRNLNPPQPPFFKVGSRDSESSELGANSSVPHFASQRFLHPLGEKGGRRGDFVLERMSDDRASPHDTFNFSLTVSPVLPANAPILRALELPALYAISNVQELGEEEFLRRLEFALQKGLRLVQLREKNLARDELHKLALRMMALAHSFGAKVLLNGDVALVQELGADGVQLTGSQLAELRERPDVDWCGASCHNTEELRRAEELGCDFALLSPVLPTQSHPGAPHLGWQGFAAIAAGASIPIFALGGLGLEDKEMAWRHGAHGVALLRQAWPERSSG